ncbi:MAG: S9 family peptidase [Blastocatellia bacterium]|nr:S9 family peptidase [Blastocatellia bacterium]
MRKRPFSAAIVPILILLSIFSVKAESGSQTTKRPVTPEDNVMLKRPQDAQISPDGKFISFHYTEPQMTTSPRNSDVWLVSTSGGEVRKLTNAPRNDLRARWSPDGKSLAFISDRSGRPQIYLIRIDGGEAKQLTNQPSAVSAHSWSPDGKYIAFLMTDPLTSEQEKKNKLFDDEQLFDADFRYSRLYTVEVATGKVTKVTEGQINVWEYDWSNDGKQFVIAVSDTTRIDEQYVRTRLDLVAATGGASRTLLIPKGKFQGKLRAPAWSPKGDQIAYLASGGDGMEPYAGRIWVVSANGGQPKNLTENFLGTFTEISWMPSGDQIVGNAIEGVYNSVLLVSPNNGEMKAVFAANENTVLQGAASVNSDGKIVAVIKEDSTHPADVWLKELSTNKLIQVTKLNPQSEQWEWGSSEVIKWKASDGLEIEGILVKPLNYEAGKRYPLITIVHGGPEAADTNGFLFGVSRGAFLLSARGYAVLMPNYRGSIGRGVAYAMADQGDMGGKEFTDIMAGIDDLIKRGLVDENRLAICGWSYGGYMTAWAVTQTNRFRAGIMGAGISNWVSFMSQTDIPYENAESHWGHQLFSNPKIYAERSPVDHISKAKTPVMIVHGAADPRVPLAQGHEFYSRLRFQGVPTTFVIYPREGHGLAEPVHQLDYFEKTFVWFDKYLK